MSFQFKFTEQTNAFNPNVRLPRTKIPFFIGAGRDKDCVVLTKLRPLEDWGNFTWETFVGNEVKEVELTSPVIIPLPQPGPSSEP